MLQLIVRRPFSHRLPDESRKKIRPPIIPLLFSNIAVRLFGAGAPVCRRHAGDVAPPAAVN